MTQTYTDPRARERMAVGLCPECGEMPSWHNGWGGAHGCTLTDNGAAQRIATFLRDATVTSGRGNVMEQPAPLAREDFPPRRPGQLGWVLHSGDTTVRIADLPDTDWPGTIEFLARYGKGGWEFCAPRASLLSAGYAARCTASRISAVRFSVPLST